MLETENLNTKFQPIWMKELSVIAIYMLLPYQKPGSINAAPAVLILTGGVGSINAARSVLILTGESVSINTDWAVSILTGQY